MKTVVCDIPGRKYDVLLGRGITSRIRGLVPEITKHDRLALLADETALRLHRDALLPALPDLETIIEIPPGENSKTLHGLEKIYHALFEAGLTRKSALILFGGGTVLDVGGFAAATWMRGIAHYNLPTTLMAQADGAVGGKTAINLPGAKNMIGAFRQPRAVVADVARLDTLDGSAFRQGAAEIIKSAVIGDAGLFDLLDENAEAFAARDEKVLVEAVGRALKVKVGIVAADETERGIRMKLNLGHTFAHAFEQAGGFSETHHGDAVAAGLVMSARLGESLDLCGRELTERIETVLGRHGLCAAAPDVDPRRVMEALVHDKKHAGGNLRFVVPAAVGDVRIIDDVDAGLVERLLR